MTWTTPKTWAVGDMATAADMNTYVRDNSSIDYYNPQCHIAQFNTQSIANSTPTYVNFDAVAGPGVTAFNWDNYGMSNLGVSPTAIFCIYPGYYLCNGFSFWPTNNSVGVRVMTLEWNRTFLVSKSTAVATGNAEQDCTGHWYFAFGDFLEMIVFQTTGGAYNVQACNLSMMFMAGH